MAFKLFLISKDELVYVIILNLLNSQLSAESEEVLMERRNGQCTAVN